MRVSSTTVAFSSATITVNIADDASIGAHQLVFLNTNALTSNVTFYVIDTPVVDSVSPCATCDGCTSVTAMGATIRKMSPVPIPVYPKGF